MRPDKTLTLYNLLFILTLLFFAGCSPKTAFYDNFFNGTLENGEISDDTLYCRSRECIYTSRIFESPKPVLLDNISFSHDGEVYLYVRVCSDRSCRENFTGPLPAKTNFKKSKVFQYRIVMSENSEVTAPLISLNPINAPPTIKPVSDVELYEDENVFLNLSADIYDADDPPSLLTLSGTSEKGLVNLKFDNKYLLLYLKSAANQSGTDHVTLQVSDSSGSSSSTSFNVLVRPVNDAPWADLILPAENELNHTTNYIDFAFMPHDVENNPLNCTLVIEDRFNETLTNPRLGERNTINVYLDDGEYSWHIFCYDESSYYRSPSRKLIVQLNPVTRVSFLTPENGTVTALRQLNFSFRVLDDNPDNCTLLLDNISRYEFAEVQNSSFYSAEIDFSPGAHNWKVECTDKLNAHSSSSTHHFEVDNTPPEVKLLSPSDGYISAVNVITFRFEVIEPHLDTCVLHGSWTDWQPNITTRNSILRPVNLPGGPHTWNVLCNDTVGNSAFAERNFSFFIGKQLPKDLSGPQSSEPITPATPAKDKFLRQNTDGCWYVLSPDEPTSYLSDLVICPESSPQKPEIQVGTWCNGTEILINDELLLHINVLEKRKQFSIELSAAKGNHTSYCPWCFDNVRDYDEEGVDCGPSCRACDTSQEVQGFTCGDGICEDGEGCSCPGDCLGKDRIILPLTILSGFVVYLFWYSRSRRRKSLHLIALTIFGFAFAAAFLNIACFCGVYCDYATKVIILLIIASSLFLIIFESGSLHARLSRYYELFYARLTLNREEYLNIREIRNLVERSSEALHHNEEAAKALYASITPLFKSLTPKGRKRVIKEIRKLRATMRSLSKKDYLNPSISAPGKKRGDGI